MTQRTALNAVLDALARHNPDGEPAGTCTRCGQIVNAYPDLRAAYHADRRRPCAGWGQPTLEALP